ncbi:energy transducer TonB [Thermomonas hydrothermalis]|uniref:TonB family C-terminal domain-containing protein n=1 Tax=Thermomonas hydrothermalis TaxID=213588 RepID=A0A1M4TLU9_9GAMM|nr:energy transducer TonB [Thermomonas hydrothermalis]SHE45344.1 TonB family C-terminal domain-containing protein [Thermomonas hydrothermalis]
MRLLQAGVLALWLACTGAQAGTAPAEQGSGESVLTMRVDGELTIGTQGEVEAYALRTELTPDIQKMLDKAIPKWAFVPIEQDGKPVRAKTPMRITLVAREIGEQKYEVKIDNVIFSPLTKEDREAAERAAGKAVARMNRLPFPRYPQELMLAGIEGSVLLRLRLNPDGSVADVFAEQSSLYNVKGSRRALDKARALLEKSATDAARKWTYSVENASAEQTQDIDVKVPVKYSLKGPDEIERDGVGVWRYEYRGPRLDPPWKKADDMEPIVGVSDLNNGEMVSGNTPFRLRDRSVLNQAL